MPVPAPALAEAVPAATTLRIATLNPGLKGEGPGLLLRDILSRGSEKVEAARDLILRAEPDILVLTSFDFDRGLVALSAFNDVLREGGGGFPYLYARLPNSGMATGLDLDHDGRLGGPRDAQGYGEYAGQGGLALLSDFPVETAAARDFSSLLWSDLPDAELPVWSDSPDSAASTLQRLSSVAHWDVPVRIGCDRLHLLTYHATTPAFDGPEDRNGLRNRDENLFWLRYLDGRLPWAPPEAQFVLLGDANLDPEDGGGDRNAIRRLLADPRLQDPAPASDRGVRAASAQGGVNVGQKGDPALDTADWRDTDGPGNLRVDYVLPAAGLEVLGSGLMWADDGVQDLSAGDSGPLLRHALVWVDIRWQAGGECAD